MLVATTNFPMYFYALSSFPKALGAEMPDWCIWHACFPLDFALDSTALLGSSRLGRDFQSTGTIGLEARTGGKIIW